MAPALQASEGLTSNSHTEVGEEARMSGNTSRSPRETSGCTYDPERAAMSGSDKIASSSEDLSQFDSHVSSSSLSGEVTSGGGGGGGGGGGKREKLPTLDENEGTKEAVEGGTEKRNKAKDAGSTVVSEVSRDDGGGGGGGVEGESGSEGGEGFRHRSFGFIGRMRRGRTGDTEGGPPSTVAHSPRSSQKPVSKSPPPASVGTKPVSEPASEPDTLVSFPVEQQRSTNTTPNIMVMSEDDMEGEEEREREREAWWSDRLSPMSNQSGTDSPYPLSDSEGTHVCTVCIQLTVHTELTYTSRP